jgi:chromosome segregation protein
MDVRAALERTEHALTRVDADHRRFLTNRDRHGQEVRRLDGELAEARSALGELEGRIAAAADRLREIGAQERASSLHRDLAEQDRDARTRAAEAAALKRRDLDEQAGALRDEERAVRAELAVIERELASIDDSSRDAAERKTEAMTTQASLAERLRGIARSREEAEAERAQASQLPTDPDDLRAAEAALASLDAFVARTEQRSRDLLDAESGVEAELREVSEATSRTEVQVASLEPRSLHASEEVARLDVRIEEIGLRLAHDFDIPPSRAASEFPPAGDGEALDVEERRLDRELRRMGPVNPLAAQEIVALDSRREFLETQLEDLRTSRRDLMRVVRTADEQMREMLVRATEDANAKFTDVIGLLFPEGGGRLRLAGADDPLEAGVEIEVRLGRKGHRRLSFLSGGEKALAGLGFLFALHLARPTPFIVLDEVDAPLDDSNLGRFLRLLDSLRTQTQVIVITHQKRTMEQADNLVGVTLNPDGTSRVVTQRLRERERAAT